MSCNSCLRAAIDREEEEEDDDDDDDDDEDDEALGRAKRKSAENRFGKTSLAAERVFKASTTEWLRPRD